jgi:hypothetical protein
MGLLQKVLLLQAVVLKMFSVNGHPPHISGLSSAYADEFVTAPSPYG